MLGTLLLASRKSPSQFIGRVTLKSPYSKYLSPLKFIVALLLCPYWSTTFVFAPVFPFVAVVEVEGDVL